MIVFDPNQIALGTPIVKMRLITFWTAFAFAVVSQVALGVELEPHRQSIQNRSDNRLFSIPLVGDYFRFSQSSRSRTEQDSPGGMLPFKGSSPIALGFTVYSERWKELLNEKADVYFDTYCEHDVCFSSAYEKILSAMSRTRTATKEARILVLNIEINRALKYVQDPVLYGRSDYWASFEETLKSAKGDCEDYAIVKMWVLKALGVPLEDMALVVVQDTRRRVAHAVLQVKLDKGLFVLDSLRESVSPDTHFPNYQPLVSLSARGAWLHGKRPTRD